MHCEKLVFGNGRIVLIEQRDVPPHLTIGVGARGLFLDRKLHFDPIARADRLLKAQAVEAGICQYRAFFWIDKETCGKA